MSVSKRCETLLVPIGTRSRLLPVTSPNTKLDRQTLRLQLVDLFREESMLTREVDELMRLDAGTGQHLERIKIAVSDRRSCDSEIDTTITLLNSHT